MLGTGSLPPVPGHAPALLLGIYVSDDLQGGGLVSVRQGNWLNRDKAVDEPRQRNETVSVHPQMEKTAPGCRSRATFHRMECPGAPSSSTAPNV